MRTACKSAVCVLMLGLLVTALAGQEPGAMTVDRKDIDQQLYTSLRDVINRGREHYNNGNTAA